MRRLFATGLALALSVTVGHTAPRRRTAAKQYRIRYEIVRLDGPHETVIAQGVRRTSAKPMTPPIPDENADTAAPHAAADALADERQTPLVIRDAARHWTYRWHRPGPNGEILYRLDATITPLPATSRSPRSPFKTPTDP